MFRKTFQSGPQDLRGELSLTSLQAKLPEVGQHFSLPDGTGISLQKTFALLDGICRTGQIRLLGEAKSGLFAMRMAPDEEQKVAVSGGGCLAFTQLGAGLAEVKPRLAALSTPRLVGNQRRKLARGLGPVSRLVGLGCLTEGESRRLSKANGPPTQPIPREKQQE